MAKTVISRSEYLQLLGLQVLGKTHAKMCEEIERSMHLLVGLEPDAMEASDTFYGDRNIEWLMARAGVTLAEGGA